MQIDSVSLGSEKGYASSRAEVGNLNAKDFAQWDRFLSDYATGNWQGDKVPPKPEILQRLDEGLSLDQETCTSQSFPPDRATSGCSTFTPSNFGCDSSQCLDSSGAIPHPSLSKSDDLLLQYQQTGYLKAPQSAWINERLQLMRRYGLDLPIRRATVDRVGRIAKSIWKTKTVIISLVFEERQILAMETGFGPTDPHPDDPPRSMEMCSALCPHSCTLSDPEATFVVPDASKDWRFARNPYALANGGPLAFCKDFRYSGTFRQPRRLTDLQYSDASANILLPTAALHSSPPTARDLTIPPFLPVGSLCIVDDIPKAGPSEFTAADRRLLHDLADMVAREFQLCFEQIRRNTESRQYEYLGAFLSSALVSPTPSLPSETPSRTESPASRRRAPTTSAVEADDLSHPKYHSFSETARQLRCLTGAHSAAILDLRSFRTPPDTRKNQKEKGWDTRWGKAFAEYRLGEGTIFLMGHDGTGDWENEVGKEGFGNVVSKALTAYYATGTTEFDFSQENPLAPVLPPGTAASCAVPLDDVDGTPTLFLILTSSDTDFQFEPADQRFVRHVGAVIAGSLLRQRALEADRAKLAFVSQISHELRTPLHGLSSQLELIQEFSSPQQLAKLRPLLDTAAVCLESLRDVLDDTLDFAKLSNRPANEHSKRQLVVADLSRLVEDIIKTTWVRKQRINLVTAEEVGIPGSKEKVDVIYELEMRDSPWMCYMDIGGMKRVLLNIIGNALKFTERGHIKIRLQELPVEGGDMTPTGQRLIGIDIEDTGCGMDESFLRDGLLFTPFVQENSFSTGAGLGMSICDSIVRRLGGKMDVLSTLGEGTTIRVTLPLSFLTPTPPVTSPPREPASFIFGRSYSTSASVVDFSRRIISDELGTLLATPVSEKGDPMDFSANFGAAIQDHAPDYLMELSLPRGRSQLSRGVKPATSIMGEGNAAPDFALEIQRLSQASGMKLPAKLHLGKASAQDEGVPGSPETPTGRNFSTPTKLRPVGDWLGDQVPERSLAPGVKVLVADDNILARKILSQLFRGKGIDFELAADGQEAVDKFKAGRFSLLLLDLQMPRKDGLQAAHEIREYETQMGYSRCRIVALTGVSTEGDRSAALYGRDGEAGPVDRYLVKGGKSLKVVLDEVKAVQASLNAYGQCD